MAEKTPKKKPVRKNGAHLEHEDRERAIRVIIELLAQGVTEIASLRAHVNDALTVRLQRRCVGAAEEEPPKVNLSRRSVQNYIAAAQERMRERYDRPVEDAAAEQLNFLLKIQADAMLSPDPVSRRLALDASKQISRLLGLDRPERHAHAHLIAGAGGGAGPGGMAVAELVAQMMGILPNVLPRGTAQIEDETEYVDVADEEDPEIVARQAGPGDEIDFATRRKQYAGSSEAIKTDSAETPEPTKTELAEPVPDFESTSIDGVAAPPKQRKHIGELLFS